MAYHVATDLGAAFGSRFGGADIGVLKDMVDAGYLGAWGGEESEKWVRCMYSM